MNELPFPALIRKVQSTCPEQAEGLSLIDYLSQRYNYLTVDEWLEQISKQRLLINNEIATAELILQKDDFLEFLPRSISEPAVSWNIEQIYENENFLVINKPANLPCHPSGAFFNHTLWAWLKQAKQLPEIHLCNRIDRESSGLVIVAKSANYANKLNKTLSMPECEKKYICIVHGKFPDQKICQGWIINYSKSKVRKKKCFVENLEENHEQEKAYRASTEFKLLQYSEKKDISLLEAKLLTGRTHQIRAVLQSINFPILGDKLYGLDENFFIKFANGKLTQEDKEKLVLERQALHAWKIKLNIPDENQQKEFKAEIPPEFWNVVIRSAASPSYE